LYSEIKLYTCGISSFKKYILVHVLGAKCVYEYNKKINLDDCSSCGIFCKTKLYTRSRTHDTRDIELLHFQIYVSMFYLISNVLSCMKSKLTLASINFVSFICKICVPDYVYQLDKHVKMFIELVHWYKNKTVLFILAII